MREPLLSGASRLLYHARVPLQHDSPAKSCFALAVEAPGNISRDISLLRRRLFAALSDTSALAFPDLIVLAWGITAPGAAAPKLPPSDGIRRRLSFSMQKIPGSFASTETLVRDGRVFLGVEGPLGDFAGSASSIFKSLGFEPMPDPPFEPGVGFFISSKAELYARTDSRMAIPLPSFSFFSCSFSLLRFELGSDPFSAVRWTTVARARRIKSP